MVGSCVRVDEFSVGGDDGVEEIEDGMLLLAIKMNEAPTARKENLLVFVGFGECLSNAAFVVLL